MTTPIDERSRAIDDLYAVFAPDVVLEAKVEEVLARIVAIDCEARSTPVPASNVPTREHHIVILGRKRVCACGQPYDHARPVPASNDGLCRWPYENNGETTYCGLYRGHPEGGVQYGHHFVALDRLPVPASNVSEGLREALAEDAALLHHYVHPDVSFEECDGARCVRRRQQIALAHAAPEGLDAIADDVRYAGGGGTSDYWRGFNDGIDKLVARLSQPDATEEAGR